MMRDPADYEPDDLDDIGDDAIRRWDDARDRRKEETDGNDN